MLETPHALVGVLMVQLSPNPVIGVLLAFFSHFVVDMVPHWNWHPDSRPLSLFGITLDLIVAEIVVFYLFFTHGQNLWLLVGAFAGILPDLIEAPRIFTGVSLPLCGRLEEFQLKIQNRASVVPGVITQIAVGSICLWLLRS